MLSRHDTRWQSRLVTLLLLWLMPTTVLAEGRGETDAFSSSYTEARARFIQAAKMAGAQLDSIRHPLTAPDGSALYIDVALLGPADAKRVLVVSSGTHGVEGFAGSALQLGLLQQGFHEQIPDDLRLVMIHAINPWGFSHLRRVNEANVDLNRNFLDHSRPHPVNPGYDALATVAAPESLSYWANGLALARLGWFVLIQGKPALKKAVSQGQYSHPQGLFYGGSSATWSNQTVTDIVRKHLSSARRVFFIDVHTGLGEYGAAEIIMNVPLKDPAYARARACWGKELRSTLEGESVSVHIHGSLKQAIPKMLPHSEVTAVSLEFGTVQPLSVFWSLRAENWLQYHATKEQPERERIQSGLLTTFYPRDEGWKQEVWRKGKSVVERALSCLQERHKITVSPPLHLHE